MVLPVLPGVVRATVAGQIEGGGRWSNTWHFRRVDLGDPDLVSITALHVVLTAFYTAELVSRTSGGTTYEAGEYTPLDGTSGAFSLPMGLTGSVGAVTLPPECAEVLTIRTALRGRQNRGRIFLPAVIQSATDGSGKLTTSTRDAIVAGAVALQAAALVIGWSNGVGSYGPYKSGGTPHFTDVSSYSMDLLFDVQRSRKR
jgi:hypothetical protein